MPIQLTRPLMTVADVFRGDAFSRITVTNDFNLVPEVPQQLRSLGVVSENGIFTSTSGVKKEGRRLRLVPTAPQDGDRQEYHQVKAELVDFTANHLPQEAIIRADQLKDVLRYRSAGDQAAYLNEELGKLYTQMRADMDATFEWRGVGQLLGKILDSDGTVLLDLFDRFGLTRPSPVPFNFSGPVGVIKQAIDTVVDQMWTGLQVVPSRIHCFTGKTFHEKLVAAEEVRAAYTFRSNNDWLVGRTGFRPFEYSDVTFERHRGQATKKDGTLLKFIPDDEAVFFPVIPEEAGGLLNTFWTPASTFGSLDQVGLPYFVNIVRDTADDPRWIKLLPESNPIDVNVLPTATVKAVAA